MKKLTAILQKKANSVLAKAKENRILSVLELAKANAEEDKACAQDEADRLILSLGDDDVDSSKSKEIIRQAVDALLGVDECQLTLDKLNQIITDLKTQETRSKNTPKMR